MFRLHERLAADTAEVAMLSLSLVLLLKGARFPCRALTGLRVPLP